MAADPPRQTADLAGSGGRLLADPSDFIVVEALPYAPSGAGEHLFVRIEKTGLTTPAAIERLLGPGAGALGVGWAGLKDRHAVASQWISVHDPNGRFERELEDVEGVRVLEKIRHAKKLKRGHVRSNHFTIVLREVPPGGFERARHIVERLQRSGVPNLFGPQRFGRDGDNAERAARILAGSERPPRRRDEKNLLMSALQSKIFNGIVELRMSRGLLNTALAGDVMQKHDTGGLFVVDDPTVEQPRVDALAISPTGPIAGDKTMPSAGDARALEDEIVAEYDLAPRDLRRLGPGTRRVMRFPLDPGATVHAPAEGVLALSFSLPSGAYATVVLDEVVKPSGARFMRAEPSL